MTDKQAILIAASNLVGNSVIEDGRIINVSTIETAVRFATKLWKKINEET